MKFGIIIGSHRNNSQSSKVGEYISRKIEQNPENTTYTVDLKGNTIPFWDESMWDEGGSLRHTWEPYSKQLTSCDGFVIISPEWNGLVPAGLKNIFLMCDRHELAYKPGMIVSISAGRGGSYPVSELRMSGYKNTYIQYIPEHIIIRDVNNSLNNDELVEESSDFYVKKRLQYGLHILEKSAEAMNIVRDSGVLDFKTYPFGM